MSRLHCWIFPKLCALVMGVLSPKAFPRGEVSPCPPHPGPQGMRAGGLHAHPLRGWGSSLRCRLTPCPSPSRASTLQGPQLLPTLQSTEGPWALLPQRSLSRPCLSVRGCFHPRSLPAWEEQGFREQRGQGLRNVWAGAPGAKPDVEGPGVRGAAWK